MRLSLYMTRVAAKLVPTAREVQTRGQIEIEQLRMGENDGAPRNGMPVMNVASKR